MLSKQEFSDIRGQSLSRTVESNRQALCIESNYTKPQAFSDQIDRFDSDRAC